MTSIVGKFRAAAHAEPVLRVREIELPILGEFAFTFWGTALFAAVLASFGRWQFLVGIVLFCTVPFAASFSEWRRRRHLRNILVAWERYPLKWNRTEVLQLHPDGSTVRVDPRKRFSVTWRCFTSGRAVYIVTQRDQSIYISSLSSNARELLVEVLNVQNFPCESWPNLDL